MSQYKKIQVIHGDINKIIAGSITFQRNTQNEYWPLTVTIAAKEFHNSINISVNETLHKEDVAELIDALTKMMKS